MRVVLGLLLIAMCLPCGSATVPTSDMTHLTGVPIRVFDLQAPDVTEAFREFMAAVPMTNDRPVPEALIADTLASLSFVKAATPPETPAYFVAAYLNKTPLVAMTEARRTRYLQRYGEAVFPQRICPVFISSADEVPQLLGAATGLPATWFENVQADAAELDRLFALTEASHCGFIARELAQPKLLPAATDAHDMRTVLEALGDFEATAVMRSGEPAAHRSDAADTLFAARLLATFVLDHETAYTAVPALIQEYRRIGVPETNRGIQRVRQSVRLARDTLRRELRMRGKPFGSGSLETFGTAVASARAERRLDTGDALADALIAALTPAVRLLGGDRSIALFPRRANDGATTRLFTFANR